MKNILKTCILVITALIGNAYAEQTTPDLNVPENIAQIYVILQEQGEPADGTSKTVDLVSRDKFIANFEIYRNMARKEHKKLIVTAVTKNQEWVQNQIEYKGENLPIALYRDPHASITYSGAEVPLD
jgi:hypothetical protein